MLFIVLLLIILLLFLPDQIGKKKNPYDHIRESERKKDLQPFEEKTPKLWKQIIKLARKLGRYLPYNLSSEKEEKKQNKINYAGLQKVLSVEDVIAIKVLFLLFAGVYFLVMFLLTKNSTILFLGLMGSLLGYFAPDSIIDMKARKRQEEMNRELPSVLTSLAIITDAGLNLVPALETLVKQSKGKSEILIEMKRAIDEINIGISQKEAFLRMSNRCNVEEVRYFISALIQGIEKGNSGLTNVIRTQAEESWQKRKFKAKELAEKASMKLFLPLLCMVFPAFAIFLVGPMIFSLFQLFEMM
jgi:tight adherence protein C